MRYERKPSFNRSYAHVSEARQAQVIHAIEQLTLAFETGQRPQGLGLRKLRHAFWEIRLGLEYRILFRLHGDLVELVVVGTHEEIRRILANR